VRETARALATTSGRSSVVMPSCGGNAAERGRLRGPLCPRLCLNAVPEASPGAGQAL